MKMRRLLAVLAVVLLTSSAVAGSPAIAAGETRISGTITYQDKNGQPRPVREALVDLVDDGSGSISYTYTNVNGQFELVAPEGVSGVYRVKVSTNNAVGSVNRDYTGGLYEGFSSWMTLTAGEIRTGVVIALDQSETGRAFSILDALYTIGNFYLSIRNPGWDSRFYLRYPSGEGSNYHGLGNDVISIAGSEVMCGATRCDEDAYDWDVIAHEIGHAVAHQMGSWGNGGPHAACESLAQRLPKAGSQLDQGAIDLAWSEGFATFFGIVAQQSPAPPGKGVPVGIPNAGDSSYHDFAGPPHNAGGSLTMPLETNGCSNGGEDMETAVAGALYDFWDNTPAEDGVSWGIEDIIDRLEAADAITFFAARDALFAGRSTADLNNAAKILEYWQFTPSLLAPTGSIQSSVPIRFWWEKGGMNGNQHQTFVVSITDMAGNELARCDCATATEFDPTTDQWNRMLAAGQVMVAITGYHGSFDQTHYTSRTPLTVSGPAQGAPVGTYSIVAEHSGMCLDVVDASGSSGARIQQWQCNGSNQQKWDLIPGPSGASFLKNKHSGKCLDLYNLQTSDGTPLQQWDCNSAQQQQFTTPGPGIWGQFKVFNKCLDIHNVSYAFAARLQLWACNGAANQRFMLTPTPPIRGYTIKVMHSNQCLDVVDVSTANGARVQQWTCNGANQQKWDLISASGGTFHLRNRNSGKCLDIYNVQTSDGTPLQQWDCNGAQQQRFHIPALGSWGEINDFGKCLDITGVSGTPGARLQLWTCNGAANQKFLFTPEPAGGNMFIPGVRLQDTAAGRCVMAPNGSNNTLASSTSCDQQDWRQYWYVEPVGSQYQLRSVAYPGICLTIPHWANYDAALYSCAQWADQLYNRTNSGGVMQYQVSASSRCLVSAHWDSSYLSSYSCGSYADMWFTEKPWGIG